mgnify:CR=1 FL=1
MSGTLGRHRPPRQGMELPATEWGDTHSRLPACAARLRIRGKASELPCRRARHVLSLRRPRPKPAVRATPHLTSLPPQSNATGRAGCANLRQRQLAAGVSAAGRRGGSRVWTGDSGGGSRRTALGVAPKRA